MNDLPTPTLESWGTLDDRLIPSDGLVLLAGCMRLRWTKKEALIRETRLSLVVSCPLEYGAPSSAAFRLGPPVDDLSLIDNRSVSLLVCLLL